MLNWQAGMTTYILFLGELEYSAISKIIKELTMSWSM